MVNTYLSSSRVQETRNGVCNRFLKLQHAEMEKPRGRSAVLELSFDETEMCVRLERCRGMPAQRKKARGRAALHF